MENSKKITAKIVNVKLAKETPKAEVPIQAPQVVMNESIAREPVLTGKTYKIRPPNLASFYITINDVELDGKKHPYEIFISSKDMDNFQWVVALTRVISAVFRKGGDIAFMVDELKSVFDPKGGYFKKGGKYMPSLVAEIGNAIEEHLIGLSIIKNTEMSETTKEFIAKKKDELGITDAITFPEAAKMCKSCNTKAVVIMDGCATCLNCGDSKCG